MEGSRKMCTEKMPISAVWPLQDGVLQIIFETDNAAVIDLQPKFHTTRFSPLEDEAVWRSVKTDGRFVRWFQNDFPIVEVTCEELLGMIVGQSY